MTCFASGQEKYDIGSDHLPLRNLPTLFQVYCKLEHCIGGTLQQQRVSSRSSRCSFPMMMTMMDGKIWQGSTATRAAGRPLWKCCLWRRRWRWRHEIDLPPTRRRRRRLCRSLHPTTNSQCLNGNVIISMQSSDLSRAMRYFPNQCLSEHLRLSILTFLQ